MAILAIFTGKGITKDMYDALVRDVHSPSPAGAIFHAAAFDSDGDVHVADGWASQADLDDFVSKTLMPAFQKHGIPAPQVVVYPAHNIEAYAAVDQYKAK